MTTVILEKDTEIEDQTPIENSQEDTDVPPDHQPANPCDDQRRPYRTTAPKSRADSSLIRCLRLVPESF